MNYKKATLFAFDVIILLFLLKSVALDFGYGAQYSQEDIARFATLGLGASAYCISHSIFEEDKTKPSS